MSLTRIAIFGAAGKMGKRLITLGNEDSSLKLSFAFEASACPVLGQDAGEIAGIGRLNLPLISGFETGDWIAETDSPFDVLIDFSSPKAADAVISRCLKDKIALVYATTGLSPEQKQQLIDASAQIPVLWSPSMSMTVILTMNLAKLAAQALKDKDADVEILERHHRFKADAPSGTALKFGEIIANEMNINHFQHGREGKIGARPHNEIGFHAIRVGDNPGEHTVVFGLLGETMELTVRASNRDAYAVGALSAAKFLSGKKPGLYDMNDVLGLHF